MKRIALFMVVIIALSFFPIIGQANSALPPSYDYEAYLEYLRNEELPEHFIPYERWEDFGEFVCYYNASKSERFGYEDEYRLSVSDAFYEVGITRYLAENAYDKGVPMEAAPENWLIAGTATLQEMKKNQYYNRSGVYYEYSWKVSADKTYCYSDLACISWFEDGNFIKLELPPVEEGMDLETYLEGVDKKHPFYTLLSPDATDHDVLVALGLIEPLFETWEIVTLAVGGAVVLAGVVTLIVLLVPKKKKPVEE